MMKHSTDYWMELLESAGVVAGPIYDMAQVYDNEQVLAREMKVTLQDDEMGELQNIGVPVKLSATPGSIRHRAPGLGEHTRAILLEHGYTTAEVDALVDGGVVAVP